MQFAILLAGGVGTRLAPLSTPQRPKQVLPLLPDGRSPLRATWDRVVGRFGAEHILVVTGLPMASAVRDQLPDLPEHAMLVEPEGRNTLPALVWAAAEAERRGGHTLVSLHADHWVGEDAGFDAALGQALHHATSGELTLVGLTPDRADPTLGWIVPGARLAPGCHRVERFVEKPPVTQAHQLMKAGALWNLGLFAWQIAALQASLARHAPRHHSGFLALKNGASADAAYAEMPALSVDRGLVEHERMLRVVRGSFPWSDLGTWERLRRVNPDL